MTAGASCVTGERHDGEIITCAITTRAWESRYYHHLLSTNLATSIHIKKLATPYGAAIIQGHHLTPVLQNRGKALSGLVKIEDCIMNHIGYKHGELIQLISHQHEG